MSDQLLADLVRDEAFEPSPYPDTEKIWTAGIGRNLEAMPLTGAEWKALLDAGEVTLVLTRPGAERLCRNGIAAAELLCARAFPWWPRLDPVRRDVITEMVFNMGMPRVLGFRDFLHAVALNDWKSAVAEMFNSKWAYQVDDGPGKRIGRVDRLAEMMRTGVRP